MKHVYYSFLLFFIISCSPATSPVSSNEKKQPQPAIDYAAQGFTKATVTDLTGLDGCKFLLKLDDGSRLQPENLDSALAKDNMPVWVKYYWQKNAISICMAGKVVHITEIYKREP